MTTFAGIDFSTFAIDVVLLPGDEHPIWHRFPLEGYDAFERTRDVREKMPSRGWWLDQGVVALGIEEPQGVSKSTVAVLKGVQGAVLSCLPRSLLVQPMVPSKWRVEAGLPGNASKDDVRQFGMVLQAGAKVLFGGFEEPCPQDAHDAACIAWAVRKLTVLA